MCDTCSAYVRADGRLARLNRLRERAIERAQRRYVTWRSADHHADADSSVEVAEVERDHVLMTQAYQLVEQLGGESMYQLALARIAERPWARDRWQEARHGADLFFHARGMTREYAARVYHRWARLYHDGGRRPM